MSDTIALRWAAHYCTQGHSRLPLGRRRAELRVGRRLAPPHGTRCRGGACPTSVSVGSRPIHTVCHVTRRNLHPPSRDGRTLSAPDRAAWAVGRRRSIVRTSSLRDGEAARGKRALC